MVVYFVTGTEQSGANVCELYMPVEALRRMDTIDVVSVICLIKYFANNHWFLAVRIICVFQNRSLCCYIF